jgi:neutral ceramidase
VRSPSFYGLINQRLEAELGGVFSFVEGASGSTHNLNLSCAEATDRIASEVKTSLSKSQRRPMGRLASLKRPFTYKVRTFDEETEDATVTACCKKWVGESAANIPPVFKQMRRQLAGIQDEQRESWI